MGGGGGSPRPRTRGVGPRWWPQAAAACRAMFPMSSERRGGTGGGAGGRIAFGAGNMRPTAFRGCRGTEGTVGPQNIGSWRPRMAKIAAAWGLLS